MTAQQPLDPNRWEPAIQKFEAEDKANPPAKGGIVFIGASSFARWTNLAESFPDLKVVNRGFGGSELAEAVKYAPRVVVPHAPRIVVLYAGENDLNRGVTPDDHRVRLRQILTADSHIPARHAHRRHRAETVAPALEAARRNAADEQADPHALRGGPQCTYVDPWPSMIGKDGTPKPEFFVEDGLHMTPEGYKAWTQMLRPHLK